MAEALSWLGLLIGMYLTYVTESTEVGVHVFGPLHGVVFLGYLAMCWVARRTFAWTRPTTVIALFCSIPPFLSIVFEVVADRRGLLGRTAVVA